VYIWRRFKQKSKLCFVYWCWTLKYSTIQRIRFSWDNSPLDIPDFSQVGGNRRFIFYLLHLSCPYWTLNWNIWIDLILTSPALDIDIPCPWYWHTLPLILTYPALDIDIPCPWYWHTLLLILTYPALDIDIPCPWYWHTLPLILTYPALDIDIPCSWYWHTLLLISTSQYIPIYQLSNSCLVVTFSNTSCSPPTFPVRATHTASFHSYILLL